MSKSKPARIITEMKGALDNALSEGLIDQKAYDQLHIPGLKKKKKTFDWVHIDDAPPPPEPEPMPEPEPVPEPAPEPAPEATPDAEYDDAAVVDDCVPEAAEDTDYAATPEGVSGTDPVASEPSRVELTVHDETAPAAASDAVSFQEMETTAKEKEMGFGFTLCFRCARVDAAQWADQYLPEEVRGDCEVDSSIIGTLCGLCRKMKGSNMNIGSFCSAFSGLGMSPKVLEGSLVHKIASTVLSREVGFVTEGGMIAYRDINTIVASLGRGDKLMSVDVERFKRGERIGLVLPYLEGGLIPTAEGEKQDNEEVDTWGGLSSKKNWSRR
ncbi:hypothetical protein KC353_g305 [Hortaea werneckii]|nr:hypothetical protein KC353_g305 [Hortaea werneckii]